MRLCLVWSAVLASSLLFTACSTVGQAPTPQGHSLNAAQVAALPTWQFDGRLAFQDSATQQGFSAALHWLNTPLQTRVDVLGPLGLGRATLIESAAGARLDLSDGRQFAAKSSEILMLEHLHWSLPVTQLRYGLFALPQPHQAATVQRDAAGRVQSIHQGTWQLNYSSYQTVDGVLLPQRIEWRQGSIHLLLVIHHWQLGYA